jgi:hypothetical protein
MIATMTAATALSDVDLIDASLTERVVSRCR